MAEVRTQASSALVGQVSADLPLGMPMLTPDHQPDALVGELQVLVRDGDELGPAQGAGVAEQQQGAVALAGGSGVAARDQLAQLVGRQRRRLLGRFAVLALDAAQGVADGGMRRRPWQVGQAVCPAEGCQPLHQRAGRMRGGERSEIGAHGFRGGRQGRPAGVLAPGAEMLPGGAVGAQGGRRQRLAGEVDCSRECCERFRRAAERWNESALPCSGSGDPTSLWWLDRRHGDEALGHRGSKFLGSPAP
jgi:hypothetical protein